MKKYLALLSAFIIALSVCSCSRKPEKEGAQAEKNTGVSFESVGQKFEKDFALPDGKIAARLEGDYPVIKCEESPAAEQQINNWFKMFFREEADLIETNLKNTEEYKDRLDIEGVTVTKITCEEYERSPTFVSFKITRQKGVNPDSDTGVTFGRSFSLADGKQLRLSDLYAPDAENPEETIRQAILDEADYSYSARGGIPLTDEQHEIMDGLYDENNFCLTAGDIVIPYSLNTVSYGARQGTYFCPLSYSNLYETVITPDDYYENVIYPPEGV